MPVPWTKSQGNSWRDGEEGDLVVVALGVERRIRSRLSKRRGEPWAQDTHSLTFAMVRGRVVGGRADLEAGDAGLAERGDPLLDVGLRPDQVAGLEPLLRDLRLGVALVAAEVEVLDLLGLLLVAVLAGELVVEVLAAGAHAADVERVHRAHEVEHPLDVLADRDHAAGGDLERAEVGGALGGALGERVAPDRPGPSRGGTGTAASRRRPRRSSATFLSPRAATHSGIAGRSGLLSSLSGLPRPRPWSAGSGSLKMPSLTSASRRRPMRRISMISRVRPSGLS